MIPAYAAAAFVAGYLCARYGDSAAWWARWLFHKVKGDHRRHREAPE